VFRSFLSSLPNRSSTQTASYRNNIKGKILERDNKNKGPKFSKVSSTTKCYKHQDYGHLAANCPSLLRITIIDGTPIEATKSDSDMYIFNGEDSETDEEPTSDKVGLNCINQTPLTHLSVVRRVPFPPAKKNDWRKSATFHKYQN